MSGIVRKVVSAHPRLNLSNRSAWALELECGHRVTRTRSTETARCDECQDESTDKRGGGE